ncbi:MFS transporter [Nocardia goodfellowii]|uniref:MFS family permease n=1 Tax=Nocardia goodfellowii TaxID=882446 RepID=A0ABS4QAM0_9NOCA|nr:MFS transporter [Nocardia goodfellowii]MBP2188749.1 MFS family permease [Nocardia goodfellowii]
MPETIMAERLSDPDRAKEARRVVWSSYLGSTLEYYDFLLYGTAAALVFGPVFFADLSPTAGTIASLGTFAAGYLSRPFGGILFGHFGDRVGRKSMLLLAMTLMGVASILIGLIPSPALIGSWAAVILIFLRVLQGIAVGGEWGGAALMALEHADPKQRGFMAAFANAGAPTGAVLGTLVMMLFSRLPDDQFLSWGWRVPFLISAVMLVVGLFVRARVSESPLFQAAAAAEQAQRRDRIPLLAVLRQPKPVVTAALACIAGFGLQTAFTTFGIGYAVRHGMPKPDVLTAFAIGQFCAIFFILGFARLSDRVGRRPVMLFGFAATIVGVFPLFWLLTLGSFAAVAIGFTLYTFCHAASYGPMAAYISEQFGTRNRYTGASLGYQLGTLLGGGFTPMILAALASAFSGSILPAGLYLIALAIVSTVTVLLSKETKDNDLAH